MDRLFDLFNFAALVLIVELVALAYLPPISGSSVDNIAILVFIGIAAACALLITERKDYKLAFAAAVLSLISIPILAAFRKTEIASSMFWIAAAWGVVGIVVYAVRSTSLAFTISRMRIPSFRLPPVEIKIGRRRWKSTGWAGPRIDFSVPQVRFYSTRLKVPEFKMPEFKMNWRALRIRLQSPKVQWNRPDFGSFSLKNRWHGINQSFLFPKASTGTGPEWFSWFAFAAIVLVIELTVTTYGLGSLKMKVGDLTNLSMIIIGLIFLVSLVWKKDSRFSIACALLSLASCPFLLIAKNNPLAEQMAVYAYLWLVAGVVLQTIEYIKENKSEHSMEEKKLKDDCNSYEKDKEIHYVSDSLLRAHIMKRIKK